MSVWQVDMAGGRRVVAKHQAFHALTAGRTDDLLAVEQKVLDLLAKAGCPVPRVLGVDAETHFLFLEHRGDRTLDEVCQTDAKAGGLLGRRVVSGFCAIESALAEREADIDGCVSPAATRDQVRATAANILDGAADGLQCLLSRCGADRSSANIRITSGFNAASVGELEALLLEIWEGAVSLEASLGSTDYNARNIVVDATGEVSFIEFAKIGWDWPERRLVQYATSLGAGRENGGFVGTLDAAAVQQYARSKTGSEAERAFAFDGHHLLFHLNAAAMLCRALAEPAVERHQALLQAWRRPRQRLGQLARAVATPMSDIPRCCEFRSSFFDAVRETLQGELT